MLNGALLMQLVIIIAVARLCGLVLRYAGQPAVIGEMAGGLLLGPIALGVWFPELHGTLFAKESLVGLTSLSTLGLVLFMFIVGAELRFPDGVRAQLRQAGWVGLSSVVVPALLTIAAAPLLHPLAPTGTPFWPFALFMATAVSITAFPVLARILKDRRMTTTPVGRLALSSAALIDVFAWIALALVVAMTSSGDGASSFARSVIGLTMLCAVLFGILRPAFAWLLRRTAAADGSPSMLALAAILIGALASAAATQWLGLHEVFGAFLFGTCLPRDDRLLRSLIERVEYLALTVLMPVFFALAGLHTTPDALAGAGTGMLALILLISTAGKLLGGAAGARIAGYSWRDSLAVGTLMNARGLMELIVIKVGLDAGLIGPALFTMLLIMALATTIMTSPLLSWLAKTDGKRLTKGGDHDGME